MKRFHSVRGDSGYVHTVTFSHRFLLFGSKLEFPWDCGTIQSRAKTLPCARSLRQRRSWRPKVDSSTRGRGSYLEVGGGG